MSLAQLVWQALEASSIEAPLVKSHQIPLTLLQLTLPVGRLPTPSTTSVLSSPTAPPLRRPAVAKLPLASTRTSSPLPTPVSGMTRQLKLPQRQPTIQAVTTATIVGPRRRGSDAGLRQREAVPARMTIQRKIGLRATVRKIVMQLGS